MASTARHNKPARKGGPEPGPRRPAWTTGARASPIFSSASTPRPQSTNVTPQPSGPSPRDRVLQSLAGLTGTTVTLLTKTGTRFEGVVASTSNEGDTTGVTLKDVKDINNPGAPLKDTLFIASTNIDSYTSGPADARPTNGDSFRTDVEITGKKLPGRERELQAWADSDAPLMPVPSNNDDDTFGVGSSAGGTWDQFTANEQLFGVKVNFDENVYTTKLDRTAPDFKERERKAIRIASEIMGTQTNNPHIAEERGIVDDSGVNEEDKYGAVVRGAGAYVPPGARRGGPLPPTAVPDPKVEVPNVSVNGPDGNAVTPAKAPSPAPANPAPNTNKPPADPLPAFRDFVTNEKQRLNQKRQALVKSEMDKRMAELVKFSQNFKLNKPIPDDLVPILAKDEEKQKAIREKASKDAASAQARAIGPSTPATASRGVLTGAKLVAKANPPMTTSKTVTANLNQTSSSSAVPKVGASNNAATSSSTSIATAATKSSDGTAAPAGAPKKINMVIQSIPPFRGSKARAAAPPTANGSLRPNQPGPPNGANTPGATPLSPTAAQAAANRLNVNAPSFRAKTAPKAFQGPQPAATTSAAATAKSKPDNSPPNPFFGTRPIKKSSPASIKDDFNPFKHAKVSDASQITALWPYSGKRYSQMYPPPPHHPQIQQHAGPGPQHHPPQPVQSPMPQPAPYDEDSAAQAAVAASANRGYVYAYPPYGYPGQMMPGMPPPPGAFMPGPYMQHMPYPPGMHPPNAMYSSAMGQMPGAHQGYMSPPPGVYPPPPNGQGPRPSMPPTPIQAHQHPYYHQSPQMQHAVPYPMMMPPPGQVPPHPYDGSAAPPQPMGGHA